MNQNAGKPMTFIRCILRDNGTWLFCGCYVELQAPAIKWAGYIFWNIQAAFNRACHRSYSACILAHISALVPSTVSRTMAN